MVRLFVGGLPPGISVEDLAARFHTFGAVTACEIAPPKLCRTLTSGSSETFDRSFGYVSLEPKDEQSLRRALQVYNGCKWRGATLRCAVARPSGVEAVLNEIKADQEADAQARGAPAAMPTTAPGTKLKLRRPFGKELVTVTLGAREVVLQRLPAPDEAAAPQAAAALWQPLSPPSGDRYTYERLLQREAQARRDEEGVPRDDADAVAEWVPRKAEVRQLGTGRKSEAKQHPEAKLKRATTKFASRTVARQPEKAASPAPEASARPPKRLRTVDFWTGEDERLLLARRAAPDLSRFGDSSDDDERPGNAGSARVPQVDGAADDDSDDDSDDDGGSERSGNDCESDGVGSGAKDSPGNVVGSALEGGYREDSRSYDGGECGPSSGEVERGDGSAAGPTSGSLQAAEVEEATLDGEGGVIEPTADDAAGHGGDDGEVPAWLRDALPAGAAFFRSEPTAQVEAAWRAGREAATRDYREKRRQAIRHTARRAAGKRGRR